MGRTATLRDYLSDIGRSVGEGNSGEDSTKNEFITDNIESVTLMFTDYSTVDIAIDEVSPSVEIPSGLNLMEVCIINFTNGNKILADDLGGYAIQYNNSNVFGYMGQLDESTPPHIKFKIIEYSSETIQDMLDGGGETTTLMEIDVTRSL